jgi:DNA helicase IV
MSHPELAQEQAYLDRAYEYLEKMRELLGRTQQAMATEAAALAMEAWAKRTARTFQDAERGLCFGRLTLAASAGGGAAGARPKDPAAGGGGGDGALRPLYVGRRWVHDDDREPLVVNWQAPAARPFYTATPSDPQRVTQRRRYRTEGRRIVDISDESLDGTALEGASVSDFLLEELERRREGRMRDIVATIQSDQYRLITAEPEGALVVQGGPGTGKTAVGLHRASWLLFTHREQLRRVLVVGPNPTFMDYVSHVLPALGEEAVEQRAVSELLDGIEVARVESVDVARLKADTRLAEVVQRAVELSVRPAPEELVLYADGVFVSVKERDVRELLDDALASGAALTQARERFRMALLRRFYERYNELLGPMALRSFDELERALKQKGFLTKYLDRVLALPRPEKLVARLLTSPAALAEAAAGVLDADEQRLLLRDRPKRASELRWSEHDLPLLDEARVLIDGPPRTYGHVIVDEAQDLSPMQLRTVSRRAVDGSLTMLGDVAQATGPVVYRQWRELEPYLPEEVQVTIEELRHAYRVPAEIMELALPLLERIAPDVEPPLAYRQGGEAPRLVRVGEDELRAAALREAGELAERDGLLAVIAPRSLASAPPHEAGSGGGGAATARPGDRDSLGLPRGDAFDETSVPVLTPREAKGLEFDHVVVVEPAAIVDEGGDSGLRELYVALTRPTKTLVVVHSREWH